MKTNQEIYDEALAQLGKNRSVDLMRLSKLAHDMDRSSIYWDGVMQLMREDHRYLAELAQKLWGPNQCVVSLTSGGN